jgi:hypothetical protein
MSITIRQYLVEIRHEGGTDKITTAAVSAAAAVDLILSAKHAPRSAVRRVWEWPECEYCDQRATRYVKDGGDLLCWTHAVDHYDTTANAKVATGELGIRRLTPADPVDWAA